MIDQSEDRLFSEFPPASTQEWEAQILKELKGKNYQESLTWKTFDGIELNSFYRKEDIQPDNVVPGHFPYRRGIRSKGNEWEIRQDFIVTSPKQGNNHSLSALMKGITSVGFAISDDFDAPEQMQALLNDILLEHISVNFKAEGNSQRALELLTGEISSRKLEKNTIRGSVEFSPLGHLAASGNWYHTMESDMNIAAQMIKTCVKSLPMFQCINVNALNFHNGGASIIQELGCALAEGNEYLAHMRSKDLAIDDITAHIRFSFAIGNHYFPEIAKLRAFRMLWAKVVEQYDPQHECSTAAFLHCNTSEWSMTIVDPHVNMLRATTQAMAAILGGCDSLTVIPYDAVYKEPDNFSERIARNIQLILKEECYLDKAADPAGGAYYIEVLTDKLAEKAWEFFQEIERRGGFIKSLESGFIQGEIEKVAQQKKDEFKKNKLVLVGVNKYPPKTISVIAENEEKQTGERTMVQPILTFRLAESAEKYLWEKPDH